MRPRNFDLDALADNMAENDPYMVDYNRQLPESMLELYPDMNWIDLTRQEEHDLRKRLIQLRWLNEWEAWRDGLWDEYDDY